MTPAFGAPCGLLGKIYSERYPVLHLIGWKLNVSAAFDREVKAPGHYPKHLVALAVEVDYLAHNVRVCMEAAAPEIIAQQDHVRMSRAILLRGQPLSQLRRHAQHRKQICRDTQSIERLGGPFRQIDQVVAVCGDVFEGGYRGLPFGSIAERGAPTVLVAGLRPPADNLHQAFGRSIR